jgi:hypothetical protein
VCKVKVKEMLREKKKRKFKKSRENISNLLPTMSPQLNLFLFRLTHLKL